MRRLTVIATALLLAACVPRVLPAYSPLADKKIASVVEYFQDLGAEADVIDAPLKFDEAKATKVLIDIQAARNSVTASAVDLKIAEKPKAIIVNDIDQCAASAKTFFDSWKGRPSQTLPDVLVKEQAGLAGLTCLTVLDHIRGLK